MATTAATKRREETDDEFDDEQLLADLEHELQTVQTLKLQTRQRIEELLQDHQRLAQQQRRLHRHHDRRDAGAATARMLQLQADERVRLAAAEAQRGRAEQIVKDGAEAAERRREYAIETDDKALDDLDAFLVEDAAHY
ncbi:unnamed protein product [Hyaloperonospora brassicae]|uniref:Uncharacterized protein n=1 Tax=Hyaloperonospora brassicae TaxID=162125 RepID=A0AAV0TX95_HYABA|nr:unnamed protein product [Hyaloperonospora brassicae]